MVTDDERREVARRLRELRMTTPGVTSVGHGYLWSLLWAVSGDELGGSSRRDWFERMCSRLADLIEPSKPEGTCGNCRHFIKDRFMPCGAAHGYTEADVSACEDFSPLSCDRDTPQKVAEEMFGKMRHSTKEEADAYEAMLKSKSVELHPVDRDALLALAEKLDGLGLSGFSSGWSSGAVNVGYFARCIRKALGVEQ